MAQVIVTFAPVNQYGRAPAFWPRSVKTQELASSGTAAHTTTALASRHEFCRITNHSSDTPIWVAVGASAVATVAGATCFVVSPGATLDLGPCYDGDRASVIDDS